MNLSEHFYEKGGFRKWNGSETIFEDEENVLLEGMVAMVADFG